MFGPVRRLDGKRAKCRRKKSRPPKGVVVASQLAKLKPQLKRHHHDINLIHHPWACSSLAVSLTAAAVRFQMPRLSACTHLYCGPVVAKDMIPIAQPFPPTLSLSLSQTETGNSAWQAGDHMQRAGASFTWWTCMGSDAVYHLQVGPPHLMETAAWPSSQSNVGAAAQQKIELSMIHPSIDLSIRKN